MVYTLGQAAKAVGKSKTTISKAIQNGKISATKRDNGSYQIDPSELHRVYPPAPLANSHAGPLDTPKLTPVPLGGDTNSIRETIGLQYELKAARQRISDLEEDRDQWRQQAKAANDVTNQGIAFQTKLLTHTQQAKREERSSYGWLKRLFSSS